MALARLDREDDLYSIIVEAVDSVMPPNTAVVLVKYTAFKNEYKNFFQCIKKSSNIHISVICYASMRILRAFHLISLFFFLKIYYHLEILSTLQIASLLESCSVNNP